MPRTKEQFEEMRERTRGIIVEKALVLFADRGFDRTSINDIALAAGISKGLAYNYFASKKDIAEAILAQAFKEFEDMGTYFQSLEDPFEIIKNFINYSFAMIEGQTEKYRLFMMFALHSEMLGMAQKVIGNFYEQFYKEMEKVFRKMGLKNAKAESRLFGAIYDGVFINYVFFGKDYPLKSVKKLLLNKYSKEEIEKLLK